MLAFILTIILLYTLHKMYEYKKLAKDVYESYFEKLNETNALNKSIKENTDNFEYYNIMFRAVEIMQGRMIKNEWTSKSTKKR